MNPVISLRHVSRIFGSQVALGDVSFDVPAGNVFALLGENGAGKSTCIRIMLGLTEPDAGQVRVLGLESPRQSLEIRRRVGYVPERPTLYEWMTVAEIGWFAAGFYPEGFLSRYQQLTAGFDLPPKRRLKHLSKGMRAKVSLALAMAHEPELLILDEPTSGLDTLVRREFLESMVDLAAAGRTVFLSSHQIGEVERVADIVAILRHGKLLTVERLDRLKDEVKEILLTLDQNDSPLPTIPGHLLGQTRRGRQCQVLVRNPDPEQLRSLSAHASVRSFDTRRPSLEEIFVAYMQGPAEPSDPAVEAVTP